MTAITTYQCNQCGTLCPEDRIQLEAAAVEYTAGQGIYFGDIAFTLNFDDEDFCSIECLVCWIQDQYFVAKKQRGETDG